MVDGVISLPSLDEAPRCSPWSKQHRLAPGGTAIRADRLMLLDVPAPWPKPIRDHPRLVGMMDVADGAPEPTRLLASLPVDDRIRLTIFRSVGGVGVRSTFVIEAERRIPDAIAAASRSAVGPGMRMVEEPAVRPSLLVCTQGSHDVCCGSDGVRFAAETERKFPDVTIYRVSHTGGHRFAPTAMSFPDGRMWAWLETADVARIIGGEGDHGDLAARCRGWWGAGRGAHQAAEVAVFTDRGWALNGTERRVTGDDSVVTVEVDGEPVVVDVEATRIVPTISCRRDGGLPTKDATEYATVIR